MSNPALRRQRSGRPSPIALWAWASRNARIVKALLMREVITRFGREGLGFAWLIGEPLIFTFGVMALWSVTKPSYEHGVRLAPFVMTGYLSVILIRHFISYLTVALQANVGLLYHRPVKPLHIMSSRILMEFGGATAAYFVVYMVLLAVGQVDLPYSYLLLYYGWCLLAFLSAGFAMILTGLSMRYDVVERITGLVGYLMIPLSGAFAMVAWFPSSVQKYYLMIPFVHCIEMIRAGVFGEFVPTYYSLLYPLGWAVVFNVIGLLLIATARDHIESE
ncbi:ABC transporter permease [Brevundimonas sp. UYEF29]|uniref:ABC transporter permease n=1 Tax=Brevundimonas sp. UYEF29 TaxID=3156346 RepID=UPI0033924A57